MKIIVPILLLLAEIKSSTTEATYECLYKEDGSDQILAKQVLQSTKARCAPMAIAIVSARKFKLSAQSDQIQTTTS